MPLADPEDPESAGLDSLPPFDPERFAVLSELGEEGDGEIVKEIVQQFLDDLEPLLGRIERAWLARDFSQVVDGAHTVKGGAGQFGLLRAEEAARRLELGAKAGDEEAAGLWFE